eukprot:13981297-Heterocapsa_arctica.AAC.1
MEETGSVRKHLVEHRYKQELHDWHKWKHRRRKENRTEGYELERQGTTIKYWLDTLHTKYTKKQANIFTLSNGLQILPTQGRQETTRNGQVITVEAKIDSHRRNNTGSRQKHEAPTGGEQGKQEQHREEKGSKGQRQIVVDKVILAN